MILINAFIIFILGALIGSFLNVVIFRYNSGRSCMKGRSHCMSCGTQLSWYELVPIFSFVFLRGKCLTCNSRISCQYPLVELLTASAFTLLFLKIGLSPFLPLYLIIASLLIIMSVYDLRHKIIPDGFVIAFDLLALVALYFGSGGIHGILSFPGLLNLLAGPILFAFFAFFWLISSGQWMGLGDAKLALGVGWLLGLSGGIFAILLAFWIGALWSIVLLTLQALRVHRFGLTMKSEIPFAPFIILSVFLQILTGWTFASLITILH